MNLFHLSLNTLRSISAVLMLCITQLASAAEQVSIDNAWVRNTLPGQDVSAAYMTLTSQQNVSLVSVESSVTKSVEIHSMSMDRGVMKMRMLKELPLTAGKPYHLAPGTYHLMMFDLKKPLVAGEKIQFELTFKAGNQIVRQQLDVPVKSADEAMHNEHGHHHHH